MRGKEVGLRVAAALLSTFILYGCGDTASEQSAEAADGNIQEEAVGSAEVKDAQVYVYTVTFYDTDATTVLSTQEVENGALVTEYIPEKDDLVFMGWFATPSLAHEFDFSQPITQDTDVFAGFMENIEDTRSFAILGSGTSSLLSVSSWGKTINEEHYMTKSTDGNVYSITLDLNEGDEFQFAIDTQWSDQRGGGYMVNTDIDGTDYFSVSGGLSESSQKSNIKCVIPGNYTFTLTTYPGADVYDTENSYYTEETKENFNSNPYDTIEWTYNGELLEEQADLNITYYIKGAIITNWEDRYEEQYEFTEKNGAHSLTINLEEGDEFLLTSLVAVDGNSSVGNEYVRYSNISDADSLSYVDGTESQNIVAKQSGTYTFTYHPDTAELTVEFTE